MGSRLLLMAVSLTVANFLYQAFGSHDWRIALDRSFFQGVTLLYVWFALKFDPAISVSVLPPATRDDVGTVGSGS